MKEGFSKRVRRALNAPIAAAALFASPVEAAPAVQQTNTIEESQPKAVEAPPKPEDEGQEDGWITREEIQADATLNRYLYSLDDDLSHNRDVSAQLRYFTSLIKSQPSESVLSLSNVAIEHALSLKKAGNMTFDEKSAILEYIQEVSALDSARAQLVAAHIANLFTTSFPVLKGLVLEHLEPETALAADTNEVSTDPDEASDDWLSARFNEPTLLQIDTIITSMPQRDGEGRISHIKRAAQVARYLSFGGETVSEGTIREAEKMIERTKEDWGEYDAIQKHVIYAATSDPNIRLSDKTLSEFERHVPLVERIQTHPATLEAELTATYKSITSAQDPITVFFNMHGYPEGITFGGKGGAPEQRFILITPASLAAVYAARYESEQKRAQAKTHPDVLILASCASGTFALRFTEELQKLHLPVPIIIAFGEAGEETFAEYQEKLFGPNADHTIQSLFDSHTWGDQHPIVIAPEREHTENPVQIVSNDSTLPGGATQRPA